MHQKETCHENGIFDERYFFHKETIEYFFENKIKVTTVIQCMTKGATKNLKWKNK